MALFWKRRTEKSGEHDGADARNWAEGEGIIAGDTNGNKMYKGFCTREQMVVFLHRLAQKIGG